MKTVTKMTLCAIWMFISMITSFVMIWVSGLETTKHPTIFTAAAIFLMLMVIIMAGYISHATSRHHRSLDDERYDNVKKRLKRKHEKDSPQWLQN